MNNVEVKITVDEETDANNVHFKIQHEKGLVEFSIPKKYIQDETFDINNYVTELLKGK